MTAHETTYDVPPFPAFPSVSRYVPIGSVEDAIKRTRRSIDACEGLSLVIGPPGTGKSLVCALLAREYANSHDVVNLGETPVSDSATFYRHLLHHLDVDFDAIPEGDLQLALVERVRDPKATDKGLLVLVDEAQSLSPDVLEAIRMTTNIMLDGQPRVYVVVCGGPKLDETLSLPALEPLTQRVAARCYLHPLTSKETRQYISDSIVACGADPDETITDEAISAVHHASSGVPRLINQLVTCAIDVAADADQSLITDSIIDRAWAELQQLPSPMIEEPKLAKDSAPVEFGELAELPELSFADEEEPSACDSSNTDCDQAKCEIANLSVESDPSPNDNLQIESNTPEPTVLFGDFDDEEEVELGSGIAQAQTNEPPPIDIESILHSEIIGIASDASHASHLESGNMAPLVDENDDLRQGLSIATSSLSTATVQWIDESNAPSTVDDDSDIVIHDDSDMLIIEDEVNLHSVESPRSVDAEEQTVTVDFQAMLSRMRHGTKRDAC